MGTLERLARAIHGHQVIAEITRDPDPAPTHAYEPDPQSGAGNCVCGGPEHHRRHPHEFWASVSRPDICVCALPEGARCHVISSPGNQSGGEQS